MSIDTRSSKRVVLSGQRRFALRWLQLPLKDRSPPGVIRHNTTRVRMRDWIGEDHGKRFPHIPRWLRARL